MLKYREDHERVDQHGFADIVKQAFERSAHGLTSDAGRRATVEAPNRAEAIAVAFARVLRGAGLVVPTSTVLAFAEALGAVGLDATATTSTGPDGPRSCGDPRRTGVFDRAFAVFWERAPAVDGLRGAGAADRSRSPSTTTSDDDEPESAPPERRPGRSSCASAPRRCCGTRTSPTTTTPSWPRRTS